MKYEAEIEELLIKNAIHLISEGGFEKATAKELTHCGGNLPNLKMNKYISIVSLKAKKKRMKLPLFR